MLPALGTHRNNYPRVLNYYDFFVGIKANSSLERFALWNVIVRCCSVIENHTSHKHSKTFPTARSYTEIACSRGDPAREPPLPRAFVDIFPPKNRFRAHTTSSKTPWPKVYYIIFQDADYVRNSMPLTENCCFRHRVVGKLRYAMTSQHILVRVTWCLVTFVAQNPSLLLMRTLPGKIQTNVHRLLLKAHCRISHRAVWNSFISNRLQITSRLVLTRRMWPTTACAKKIIWWFLFMELVWVKWSWWALWKRLSSQNASRVLHMIFGKQVVDFLLFGIKFAA